jgi:tRNA dimethylallyltransferase
VSAPVVYLVGPTGAGKSTVAAAAAEEAGAEIVNADAFQLYRGLEVLTAAPTVPVRARVPHHLYGVLELGESCDAARYASMARTVLADLSARGVPAIVVGGSGLYVKALTHGLSDLPSDAVVRAELAARPLDDKVEELRRVDPVGAAAINLANERHVDRALEIWRLTGTPASDARAAWEGPDPVGLHGALLTWDREVLCERIDRRVEEMFAGGVIDEVSAVLASGRAVSSTAEKAIGFREIVDHLAGRRSRADVVAAIQQATRRYAKRQMTWFRRERWLKTVCLDVHATPHSAAAAIIREFFP